MIEIKGKKYIKTDLIILKSNAKKYQNLTHCFNCIHHEIKTIVRDGFFSKGYTIITFLVPEENIIEFNENI
ncbi:hypothetical protein [Tenacibaculum ovolyticum]|uniref:hypothetical protein n=1 Tax=Tenacibaculum ovolyticum TaxID=104270 RepID=UPI001F3D94FB|nr:hypothetical protein [Tenacibaculum ovolyticum]